MQAHEQKIRDEEHIMDMLALKKKLASKQITQQEYAAEEYRLRLDYARKTTEAAIDALELEPSSLITLVRMIGLRLPSSCRN